MFKGRKIAASSIAAAVLIGGGTVGLTSCAQPSKEEQMKDWQQSASKDPALREAIKTLDEVESEPSKFCDLGDQAQDVRSETPDPPYSKGTWDSIWVNIETASDTACEDPTDLAAYHDFQKAMDDIEQFKNETGITDLGK